MIGQNHVLQLFKTCQEIDRFPRFLIITGPPHSGKRTLAHHVADKYIKAHAYVTPALGVDAVRETIDTAYKCVLPTVYCFENADKMSSQAKSALLKITEEPPRQAYFMMTLSDMSSTLDTLKSRSAHVTMEPYTKEELKEYFNLKKYADDTCLQIASTPGQIEQLMSIDAREFIAFCYKVLNNIGIVTGVNAFKIANSFRFKEDAEGYDPILFLDSLIKICMEGLGLCVTNLLLTHQYVDTIQLCCQYKNEMLLTGVKKDSTFDMFILSLKEVWKV